MRRTLLTVAVGLLLLVVIAVAQENPFEQKGPFEMAANVVARYDITRKSQIDTADIFDLDIFFQKRQLAVLYDVLANVGPVTSWENLCQMDGTGIDYWGEVSRAKLSIFYELEGDITCRAYVPGAGG